jgi:hypothetical protein
MGAEIDSDLRDAHRQLTEQVMGRRGVTGTAVGRHQGRPCLKVYVDGPEAGASIPRSVGGYPVVVEESGTLRRL